MFSLIPDAQLRSSAGGAAGVGAQSPAAAGPVDRPVSQHQPRHPRPATRPTDPRQTTGY